MNQSYFMRDIEELRGWSRRIKRSAAEKKGRKKTYSSSSYEQGRKRGSLSSVACDVDHLGHVRQDMCHIDGTAQHTECGYKPWS